MKLVVMALTTGLATGPAMAVLSGDTGQIHGRAPTIDGKLQAVFPDGVTVVADDVVVGGSQIPSHFSLLPQDLMSQDLTAEDEDGDTGLSFVIDATQASLSWFRNDIPFTTNQLTTSFSSSFNQNDALRLEVSAPVIVSSTTGLPTTAGPVIHTTHYLLRGPNRYTPVIDAHLHPFTPNSGFPTTGFTNAQFDILMNGANRGANSDYRWEVSERWLSIDENGRILFERKPDENESRTVSVKATHKQNGEIWTWSFTVETWFTGFTGNGRMTWQAARDFCNAQGLRLAERTELTAGTNIRAIGSLFSEWGTVYGYSGNANMSGLYYSWTSSPEPERDGFYYQVLLSDGATISASINTLGEIVCRER